MPATSIITSLVTKFGSGSGPVLGANGSRSYRRVWIAQTIAGASGKQMLDSAQTIGVPRIGAAMLGDASATCTGVEPEQNDENQTVWEIVAE